MRSIMNVLCILMFILSIFSEPSKFNLLAWICIAFINNNTDNSF